MTAPASTRVAGACVAVGGLAAACAVPPPVPAGPVTFESASVVIDQDDASHRLEVEVARSPAQQERGLSARTSLAPDAGMLFLFTEPRGGDDGFWMWNTSIPLDIAFIDRDGVIVRIMSMEPCLAADVDDCPGYFPEVEYASALEVNRGWFEARGIEVGAEVRTVGGRAHDPGAPGSVP